MEQDTASALDRIFERHLERTREIDRKFDLAVRELHKSRRTEMDENPVAFGVLVFVAVIAAAGVTAWLIT